MTFTVFIAFLATVSALLSLHDLAEESPKPPKPTRRSTTVFVTLFWLAIAAWGGVLIVRALR